MLGDFPCSVDKRPECRTCHRGPETDPAHAPLGDLVNRMVVHVSGGQQIDRAIHLRAHRADRVCVRQARCVHHVGTGIGVCLQSCDGVGQVCPAIQKVLGTGGERERKGQIAHRVRCRGDAVHRLGQREDRGVRNPGGILDRPADQPRGRRFADGHGDVPDGGAAVLQVCRNRQVRGRRDVGRVGQRLGLADQVGAVLPAEGEGQPGTGGGQCGEAITGEDPGRPGIPRVGDHECPGLVKGSEHDRTLMLGGHVWDATPMTDSVGTPAVWPTRGEVAARIDHTLLKPEATPEDVQALIAEATDLGVLAVCVAAVAGFPSGKHLSSVKAHEAALAVSAGATEIDMVIDVGAAVAGDFAAVQADIEAVRRAIPSATLKVIIESAALLEHGGAEAVRQASRVSEAAGADFVKTSTGFHPAGGASVEAVRIMAETVGGRLEVKASGGIRTAQDAAAMLQAGATRLGLSSSRAVLDGFLH